MASGYAPWWRRTLHRFAPFLFKKCAEGNFHWRWERWCHCQAGENGHGSLDMKTGKEWVSLSEHRLYRRKEEDMRVLAAHALDVELKP